MVSIIKNVPIPGLEVIPCRLNGPRGVVKSFVAYDDRSTVIIDTGYSDEDANTIVDRLDCIGRSPDDITFCLLTHSHGDHIGGLQRLRFLAEFPVVAHEADAERIQANDGVRVDRLLRGGEEFAEGGGMQIIHVPGHTFGSIAVYFKGSSSLVAGDAILSAGEHLIVSPAYLCADPEQAQESVRRLLAMDLDIKNLLTGHGDDVYGRAAQCLGRIFAGPRTAW